jgi:hypothetical protein
MTKHTRKINHEVSSKRKNIFIDCLLHVTSLTGWIFFMSTIYQILCFEFRKLYEKKYLIRCVNKKTHLHTLRVRILNNSIENTLILTQPIT